MTDDMNPLREEQMQSERLARAQEALLTGEMQVFATADSTWTVASKGNRTSFRAKEPPGPAPARIFPGAASAFTLTCKHIEAVRITKSGQELFPQRESYKFTHKHGGKHATIHDA